MKTKNATWNWLFNRLQLSSLLSNGLTNKGQAMVEFTLVFILLLIVAWIPADFGLAMYTAHVAQNASREGARIAAADPTLAPGSTNCTWPCTGDTTIKKLVSDRLSTAMLSGPTITLTRDPVVQPACNAQVTLRVSGTYNYWFYRMLRWFGVGPNTTTLNITRETSMRWEHQC
jgi:Flp pilus assembly protein TadG